MAGMDAVTGRARPGRAFIVPPRAVRFEPPPAADPIVPVQPRKQAAAPRRDARGRFARMTQAEAPAVLPPLPVAPRYGAAEWVMFVLTVGGAVAVLALLALGV